jgi:hypothetical protein
MISDTLAEAATQMRGELNEMPDSYPPGDPLTTRVVALIEEMDAVQQELEDRAAADLTEIDRQYQLGEMGDGEQPL